MLEVLRIKNLAIIETSEIHFNQGLNIISGETGAGKSILIDAISLLLGARASIDLIRDGCEELVVEGLFNTKKISWVAERLVSAGFHLDGSELLIKRIVSRSGKHRAYINGELATLNALSEISSGLVELCGQMDHQSLFKSSTQMKYLDRYGNHSDTLDHFRKNHSQIKHLEKELDSLKNPTAEMNSSEFIQFQITELESARLIRGEEELLRDEKKAHLSVIERSKVMLEIAQLLDGRFENDTQTHSIGVLDQVSRLLIKVQSLYKMDSSVGAIVEHIEKSKAELECGFEAIKKYEKNIENGDEDRLSMIDERLALIASFRRKYGDTTDKMIATLQSLKERFDQISQREAHIAKIETQLNQLWDKIIPIGQELTKFRKKSATKLSEKISRELTELRMEGASFQIKVEMLENKSDWSEWACCNQVQFFIRTNPGETPKLIQKIASGGEISRMMLALRRVINDEGGIGVFLFDEIDAGMGGQTAFVVGQKLKSVSTNHQVICITHLPQVASFADHHIQVTKSNHDNRSVAEIKVLNSKNRIEELARMIGGPKLTQKNINSAEELVKFARRTQSSATIALE